MANPNTGEIYPLAEGQLPKPGDLLIDSDIAERLKELQLKERLAVLAQLRDQYDKGDY